MTFLFSYPRHTKGTNILYTNTLYQYTPNPTFRGEDMHILEALVMEQEGIWKPKVKYGVYQKSYFSLKKNM